MPAAAGPVLVQARGDTGRWSSREQALAPAIVIALGARYAMDSLRHRRERGQGYSLSGEEIDVGSEAFLAATEAITSAPIAVGNGIEVFVNGDEIFPAMLETIASARRSVNLVTYVYWPSEIGRTIAAALCERARAGVAVNVLLDAIGCSSIESEVVRDMEDAGVTFAYFRPLKPYAVRRVNNRTHRKLLVADGEVGMTGGVGIADQWTGNAQDPDHWRDTHVRVRGPVVRGLQGAFAENWLEATGTCSSAPSTSRISRRARTGWRCRSCAHRRASATPTSRRCSTSQSPARAPA